jgi:hypothetical protein
LVNSFQCDRTAALAVQRKVSGGMEAFLDKFEQRRSAELDRQSVLQAFEKFKAEQQLKEQAERALNEARTQELAKQRQLTEEKAKASPARKRDGPSINR